MPVETRGPLSRVEECFADFEKWAAEPEVVEPAISAWSVGKHIDHLCFSMVSIARALRDSEPPAPPARFSFARFMVLRLGFIPRGRAQAPRVAQPQETPSAADLKERLAEARAAVDDIAETPPDRWFRHPVLDVMSAAQGLRFIAVHNRHHWKIVREIRAKLPQPRQ